LSRLEPLTNYPSQFCRRGGNRTDTFSQSHISQYMLKLSTKRKGVVPFYIFAEEGRQIVKLNGKTVKARADFWLDEIKKKQGIGASLAPYTGKHGEGVVILDDNGNRLFGISKSGSGSKRTAFRSPVPAQITTRLRPSWKHGETKRRTKPGV
jgi:hypothetical protein